LFDNKKLDIDLNMEVLKEVIMTKKYNNDIRSPEMSLNKLSISSIKKMPVVLGEVDP
jgi:hypothetical protein